MNRRAFVSGIALTALSQAAISTHANGAGAAGSDDQVVWSRYAAKRDGRRPGVILLHGMHGFEPKLPAYERYANALTAEGIDAYLVVFYSEIDSQFLKASSSKADQEAYDTQRYDAWTKRVSSALTTILQGDYNSDRIGLLGFSLGGFVASATAARDSRVSALGVLYGGMPHKIVPEVKRMPPMIELHGDADRDVPLATGQALVTLAKAVGAPAEQITYPGKGHGFDLADNDPATSSAVDRVAQFFRAQFELA